MTGLKLDRRGSTSEDPLRTPVGRRIPEAVAHVIDVSAREISLLVWVWGEVPEAMNAEDDIADDTPILAGT